MGAFTDLRRAWRAFRREAWLWVATVALDHALDACEMPEDVDTVRRIHDATRVWL